MGKDWNSIKVNFIKQNDDGFPIRQYLAKYQTSLVCIHPWLNSHLPKMWAKPSGVGVEQRLMTLVRVFNPKTGFIHISTIFLFIFFAFFLYFKHCGYRNV